MVGWGRMTVQEFSIFALSVYMNMTENAALFPKPTVDLAVLKANLDQFRPLISEATYSDSRVIVQRDQLRAKIHKMLRPLAHYVEDLANVETDRTTQEYLVARSGFKAMPAEASGVEMLFSRITRVDNPRTGVLHVRYTTAGRRAGRYDVRMAVKETPDPDSWPIHTRANAKSGAVCEGLTPGVIYTFQVRVFGPLGFGDWSPAVDKMCT